MATVRSRAQVARRALALPGVLIAVVVAGLLGSPAIAQAAVGAAGTPAASAQHAASASTARAHSRPLRRPPAPHARRPPRRASAQLQGSATSAGCLVSATRGPAV